MSVNNRTLEQSSKVQPLQQVDSVLLALGAVFFAPHADLNLSDVGFFKEEHTHSALTDSAAHSERHVSVKKTLVERKRLTLRASALGKLQSEALRIDPYSH